MWGQGDKQKMSPTPMLRTANAIQQIGKDTPIQGLTDLVGGIMGAPERWARSSVGINELGQYQDAYVDRQISAMVMEGKIDVNAGLQAMVTRSGTAYDEAMNRAKYDQTLKTPLAAEGMAIKSALQGKTSAFDAAGELLPSMFPAGILSKGELEGRGQMKIYQDAWKKYDAGDKGAVTQFYNDHPEYTIRLNQFKDPEQRMRNLLTGQIWDGYTALSGPNKTLIKDQLGPAFQQSFLDKTLADNTAVDLTTMARWARILGAAVPKTDLTAPVLQQPVGDRQPITMYAGRVNDAVNAYWDEKAKRFPNIAAIQAAYYAPGANKKAIDAAFPELKQYTAWNKLYKTQHPEVAAYEAESAQKYADANPTTASSSTKAAYTGPTTADFDTWNPILMNQVFAWAYDGKALTTGAKSELYRLWNKSGQPGETFPDWLDQVAQKMRGTH